MKTDVEFLECLVRIPSESSNVPEVNRAMEAMRGYLEARGVSCATEQMGGRRVLYASTRPGKTQDYLLNAHLDVVPAEPGLFEPRVEGDMIYGRGVDDCKGCAVAVAQVLCALAGRASVGAIFSGDEEVGGQTTAFMVGRGYAARKLVVVLDATAFSLVSAEKGAVNLTLRARGRAAHSSRPWEGDNAIERLLDGYARLRAAWPRNTPGEDGDTWFDTMSANIVRGGEAHNKVPDEAELLVNVRFTHMGDERRIGEFVRETTGLDVEAGEVTPPVFCDESEPTLLALRAAMRKAWPDHDISFGRMCGATDARHFAAGRVPIAIIGIDGGGCHTGAEWARLPHIGETASMLAGFMGGGAPA